MQPEAGLLSGTIDRMDDQTLRLIDFSGGKWEVTYEGAFIAPVLDLQAGEQIKIVGSLTKKDSFHADEIRPWGGPLNIPGNGRGKK